MDKIREDFVFYVIMNMDRSITVKHTPQEAKDWILKNGGCRKLIKSKAIKILNETKIQEVLKDNENILRFPKKPK